MGGIPQSGLKLKWGVFGRLKGLLFSEDQDLLRRGLPVVGVGIFELLLLLEEDPILLWCS